MHWIGSCHKGIVSLFSQILASILLKGVPPMDPSSLVH